MFGISLRVLRSLEISDSLTVLYTSNQDTPITRKSKGYWGYLGCKLIRLCDRIDTGYMKNWLQ